MTDKKGENGGVADGADGGVDARNIGFRGRLRKVREHLNRSQAGMDELLGIGKKSWQRYESGGHTPGAQVITALVRLGINANWLLEASGPMLYPSEDARKAGEMMVRDALERDKEAAGYREEALRGMGKRLREVDQAVAEAVESVGYEPTVDARETIKELLFSGHLDAAGAIILLRRLKGTFEKGG